MILFLFKIISQIVLEEFDIFYVMNFMKEDSKNEFIFHEVK